MEETGGAHCSSGTVLCTDVEKEQTIPEHTSEISVSLNIAEASNKDGDSTTIQAWSTVIKSTNELEHLFKSFSRFNISTIFSRKLVASYLAKITPFPRSHHVLVATNRGRMKWVRTLAAKVSNVGFAIVLHFGGAQTTPIDVLLAKIFVAHYCH